MINVFLILLIFFSYFKVFVHHWTEGNCTGKCSKCRKPIKSYNGIAGLHCRWCQMTVRHDRSFVLITNNWLKMFSFLFSYFLLQLIYFYFGFGFGFVILVSNLILDISLTWTSKSLNHQSNSFIIIALHKSNQNVIWVNIEIIYYPQRQLYQLF